MKIKDIMIYSLVLAASVSCQKDIPYDFDKAEDKLVVNAQMRTCDSLHAVYLSISTSKSVEKIKSGSVTCFVNGNHVADAVQDALDDEDFIRDEALPYDARGSRPSAARQTRFVFKTGFKPGDKVRLECSANDGRYSAHSEIVVPAAPAFHAIDTSMFYNTDENSDFYHRNVCRIRIKGSDIPGERTYFRLTSEFERTIYVEYDHASSDEHDDSENQEFFTSGALQIESGKDPILSDGSPDNDIDIAGSSQNYYHVFSDYLFRDGAYDFTYQVSASAFLDESDYDYGGNRKKARMIAKVYPILWGISETEYNFLKALSLYIYNGDDLSFTGPISIPTNVEGGIGVVSIATPSRDTIVFSRTLR